MELRPYQHAAVSAVERELALHRSTLAVLPTGTGKTILFAHLAARFRPRGRVLVLAHREELLLQAQDKIQRSTSLRCGIEMAERRAAMMALSSPDVVIASVQTLAREKRRASFRRDDFSLIVVDEAHHAAAASYRGILEHFTPAKVLGVTATPDRGDGKGLGAVFESVAYEYEIRRAIADGYLVPIRQRAVAVKGLDFSAVRTTAGDLNDGDLERILTEEQHLHGVAGPLVQLAGDRPTMVFATTVQHARLLAQVIERYAGPGSARALDGTLDSAVRRAALADFTARKFRFLVNCQLFTEGFDEPAVSCVAMARPTKSRALYAQCIGRGTRLSPATGKRDLLVLDFEGNAGKHALVSTVDVLAGKATVEVKARAKKLIARDPQLDMIEAIDRAAIDLAREREQLEARRRQRVVVRAGFEASDVNPFTSLASILGVTIPPAMPGAPTATVRQLDALAAFGVDLEKLGPIDVRQATQLIDGCRSRRSAGLCSVKQARLLARYGYAVEKMTLAEASSHIGELANNGWKRPATLVRSTA